MATTSIIYRLIARDSASRTFNNVGRSAGATGGVLKKAFAGGALAVGGLGVAVLKVSGDFEKSMNRVEALSGASGKSLEKLRDQAKDLGATTQYSAKQTADGMALLAAAGLSTNQIYKAMPSILSLAASEQLDLSRAADISTNVLTGYGMKVTELAHANDALVKASIETNTSVDQLGEAFKYAGPIAHTAGLKFEEATAAMALMGNAGIQASMAGTSLRGAVTRLLAPTAKVAGVLKDLGVKVSTSSGKLLPLHTIIDQLAKSGATTGQIMTIFGQRAGPGMAALIQQGSAKLVKLTKDMEHSGGTADRIAKVQMKGLNGQLIALKSAWQGLLIEIGDTGVLKAATKAVIGITRSLRGMTAWINDKGVQSLKTFRDLMGALIPVKTIKDDAKAAVGVIADFLDAVGISGSKKSLLGALGLDKKPKVPKGANSRQPKVDFGGVSTVSRFAEPHSTSALTGVPRAGRELAGPPHGTSALVGVPRAGKPLVVLPHGTSAQISAKARGGPLGEYPHVGSGQISAKATGKPLVNLPHGGSGLTAALAAPPKAKKTAGEKLAKTIMDALDHIDWPKIGAKLGTLLGSAIGNLAKGAVKLTAAFGRLIGGVDWVDVGKTVGKTFLPFAVGFIFNLFEPLFSLDFWKKHWLDTILAVLAIIPIGRIAGVLGKVFGKIPFLKVLEGPLSKLGGLGKFIEKMLGKVFTGIVKPIGKGLKSAFTRVLPETSSAVGKFFEKVGEFFTGNTRRMVSLGRRIPSAIQEGLEKGTDFVAGKALEIGAKLIKGAKDGIVAAAKGIGRWAQRTIGEPIVRGFDTARTWLYVRGSDLLTGLKNGITDAFSTAVTWLRLTVINPIISGFDTARIWLYSAGGDLLAGLKDGVVAAIKGVGGFLKKWIIDPVVNGVKALFGIQSPSTVFATIGRYLISGLKSGISGAIKGIGKWLYSVVISPVKGAFATASTWLKSAGSHAVSGLKSGIGGAIKGVGHWLNVVVITPVKGAFSGAGSWLYGTGKSLIKGMKSGIGAGMKGMSSWLYDFVIHPVVAAVKHYFGIHSPSTVFAAIGGHLVSGLFKGLAQTNGTQIAKKVFGDLPHALGHLVDKGLVKIGSLSGRAMSALGSLGGDFADLLGLGNGHGRGGSVAIGKALSAAYGWSGPQWTALYNLWQGESGWNPNAVNKSSGAYGIPQALGHGHPFNLGDAGAQIKWGLNYIKHRYGSPMAAYSAWLNRSPHWYDSGGFLPQGTSLVHNGTGKREPTAVFTPTQWDTLHSIAAGGGGAAQPLIGSLVVNAGANASAEDIIAEAMFAARVARRRGVHAA